MLCYSDTIKILYRIGAERVIPMRKILSFVLALVMVLAFAGCEPEENTQEASTQEASTWDCTVMCAEDSAVNAYVTTYSKERVISKTGILCAENQNDFPIVVHFITNGASEQSVAIEPGNVGCLEDVITNQPYQIGIHADVAENTEIKVQLYDGNKTVH